MKRTRFPRSFYFKFALLVSTTFLLTAYSGVNCDPCDPTICNELDQVTRISRDSKNLGLGDSIMLYYFAVSDFSPEHCCKGLADYASICTANSSISPTPDPFYVRAKGGARLTPDIHENETIPDQYCRVTRSTDDPPDGGYVARWDYDENECECDPEPGEEGKCRDEPLEKEWVVMDGGASDLAGGHNTSPKCPIPSGLFKPDCGDASVDPITGELEITGECELMLTAMTDVVENFVRYLRDDQTGEGLKVILVGNYKVKYPQLSGNAWYNGCVDAWDTILGWVAAKISDEYNGGVYFVSPDEILTARWGANYYRTDVPYGVDHIHPSVETTFSIGSGYTNQSGTHYDGVGDKICIHETGYPCDYFPAFQACCEQATNCRDPE